MVMVRGLLPALLLTACYAQNPAFCPDGVDPDGECARVDAAPVCYGVAPFIVCVTPPQAPRTLGRIDTNVMCDELVTVGRELCVVKGTDVHVVQRIRVTGARPLVLLASNALTVDANGLVDAAGTSTAGGPGADLACDASGTAGENNATGAGGGAGGSFGSRGGRGGSGGGSAGTPGTAAMPVGNPSVLQGGCSGTDGGDGNAGTRGGRGFGGGGVYLLAGQMLSIQGSVNASGGGGRGGRFSKGGGGGGGSGGMIVLYAPVTEVTDAARLFANGGGGGSGAKSGGSGGDGATAIEPFTAAAGGVGQGGAGGAGAFMTTPAGTGMSSADGGGGGGGGVGVIYILGGDFSAAGMSPPPT